MTCGVSQQLTAGTAAAQILLSANRTHWIGMVSRRYGRRGKKMSEPCLRKNLEFPPKCIGPEKCIWEECYKVKQYRKELDENPEAK